VEKGSACSLRQRQFRDELPFRFKEVCCSVLVLLGSDMSSCRLGFWRESSGSMGNSIKRARNSKKKTKKKKNYPQK